MTIMNTLKQLAKCSTKTKERDGTISIQCKLGLWGVNAGCEANVINEALHYFMQYKSDGEYSSIIGGLGVVDSLINK